MVVTYIEDTSGEFTINGLVDVLSNSPSLEEQVLPMLDLIFIEDCISNFSSSLELDTCV